MKLKDYVKEVLLDVSSAVYEAKHEAEIAIAPGSMNDKLNMEPQFVSFSVSVTTNKEGSGGIDVLSAFHADGKLTAEHVNKVEFKVPIYFQAKRPSNLDK